MNSKEALNYLHENGVFIEMSTLYHYARRGMGIQRRRKDGRKERSYTFEKDGLDLLIKAKKELITLTELADVFGCSVVKAHWYSQKGLPHVDVFGHWYYDIKKAKEWFRDWKDRYKHYFEGHKKRRLSNETKM